MKLKKLELFGFKSFADKTEIVFEDGITVIVGPNGCGKSNVIDAVKWVLGEQSVKSLRGNEMADVIFSGTESRPSLGYAEVSLTILNDRGLLPLEYSEVCITRRLYSSGESEYLINKQFSRLKDIRDLFLDTGFGADAHSVIEQGNVEALLQANAHERRFLFEEVAGISKFKVRKKVALSKLEHVEQNLLRVNDIIEELQKQLRSIKLQASKARKYQEYTEQLKKLKVGISLKNYRELKGKKNEASENISQIETQSQKMSTNINDLEIHINEVENSIKQLQQQLSQSQTELINIESQISNNHDKIKYNHERIKELENQYLKYTEEQKILENKVCEISEKISETKDLLNAVEQEISKFLDIQKAKETELKQVSLECDLLYQSIDEKKSEVINILQKESTLQNEVGSLNTENDALKSRKLRLSKRQEEIDSSVNILTTKHTEITNEKKALNEEFGCLNQKLSATKERVQKLVNAIQSLDEQFNQQKQSQVSKTSRHEILMDYEMRAEGIDSGAVSVLDESKKEHTEIKGIRGMIADLLKVDLTYAQAIESALGEKAQGIITNTTEDAVRALIYLQANQKGRAIFLPLDRTNGQSTISEELLQKPDVIGIASKLINIPDDVCKAINSLLNNTVIVKDLNSALALSSNTRNIRFVTLDGELLESAGTISGGKKHGQVGIISRKSELVKLEQELTQINQTIEQLKQNKDNLIEELKALETGTTQLTKRVEEINILKISKDSEIVQHEKKRDELMSEKNINEGELEEINIEEKNILDRECILQDEMKKLNHHRKELEQQIEDAFTLVKEKDFSKKVTQDEITTLKVNLAQKREKKDGLNNIFNELSTAHKDAQEQIKRIANESQNCQQKKSEVVEDIRNLEIQINELQNKKTSLEESINSIKIEQNTTNLKIADLKTYLEEKYTELKQVEQKSQEFKLKENEYQIRISNLEDRIREDYHLELSAIDTETGEINLELSTLQAEKSDELQQPTIDFWEAVSKEIEELQGKIERLGNVNLDAIKEQGELESRESFLINQKEDLGKAQDALQNLIKRINSTSRELFEKAFNDIRQNFQIMFRKLFGGGKADLIMEENVDILEAGIEIVAQPPNKDLRSITLLSGGEKVMTTVALLFAAFQAKPSPFCILDEVDAALDESNINRFILLVKEFIHNTQFLIITHSKVTMSIANILYGITMQEPGVSKRVVVKFEEIERKVA